MKCIWSPKLVFVSGSLTKLTSYVSRSAAGQQNPDSSSAAAGSGAQRGSKDLPTRRKDDAKQPAKKPKENALSQFDLNNYASKGPCFVLFFSLII